MTERTEEKTKKEVDITYIRMKIKGGGGKRIELNLC